MPIELPTKPIPPSRRNPKVLLLYGQPKVGKTTILAQLDNCLILECDDGGADFVSALKIQLTSFDHFIEVTSEIIKQGKPYKYIALDTTSKFEEWCETDATKEYKKSNQGKNFTGDNVLTLTSSDGFSPGYLWLRESFKKGMIRLLQCAPHIILIAHMRDKMLRSTSTDKGKTDTETASKDIDQSGKIKAMMCAGADAIGYIYRTANQDGSEQTLRVNFKTHEFVNNGGRAQHLIQQDMKFDWSKIYLD